MLKVINGTINICKQIMNLVDAPECVRLSPERKPENLLLRW